MEIIHHGAVSGVTGSCHELQFGENDSVLVDCGLFQGAEMSGDASAQHLEIDFPVHQVRALLVTHCHIDHVGRIPYLIAAGFDGPIYCSEATALLLPLVLEDAMKMGITRDRRLVAGFVGLIKSRTRPLPYGEWRDVPLQGGAHRLAIRLQRAGHILGSAYIECRVTGPGPETRVVFSGDLGAARTPLLPSPRPPESADLLVLESTYGDREHEGRASRVRRLKAVVERCFRNRGVILIPAFSIGRTQELLYELEEIIDGHARDAATDGLRWEEVEIILDSPLAARFTESYIKLKPLWDAEARERLERGRHPLNFAQLTTIDDHPDHMRAIDYLRRSARPCIVIAASGMCAGGRIVNYLKALLGDERTDVLFVGYQAAGTPGRTIQRYGPEQGYVELDGERFDIRAGVHTLTGYSAHADRRDLVAFVGGMTIPPGEIRLVHGDRPAKEALKGALERSCPQARVWIP